MSLTKDRSLHSSSWALRPGRERLVMSDRMRSQLKTGTCRRTEEAISLSAFLPGPSKAKGKYFHLDCRKSDSGESAIKIYSEIQYFFSLGETVHSLKGAQGTEPYPREASGLSTVPGRMKFQHHPSSCCLHSSPWARASERGTASPPTTGY
jgi:hypothetical protein